MYAVIDKPHVLSKVIITGVCTVYYKGAALEIITARNTIIITVSINALACVSLAC